MQIINKGAFKWGGVVTIALLFLYIFSNPGTAGGGNMLKNLSIFEQILSLIPGVLLIIYGLFPDTVLGKGGELIYRLYSWVYNETKK